MKKRILVHIYSYKNSELLDMVDSLISNAHDSEQIDIYIDDQNNLTRYEKFLKHRNVFYNPVWWDELVSPLSYRVSCIKAKKDSYDYCLFLNKATYFLPNWDIDLINLLPNNSIFSGKGKTSCSVRDNFYIIKENSFSNEAVKTGIVDNSFIFGKMADMTRIVWPIELKYYGIDEYLSVAFLNKSIDVYSLASTFYMDKPDTLLTKDYVPFSLHHNYNDVINLLKNGVCSKVRYEDANDFVDAHGLKLDQLFKLPFDFNDILYNRFSELDNIGGRRYIEKRGSVS